MNKNANSPLALPPGADKAMQQARAEQAKAQVNNALTSTFAGTVDDFTPSHDRVLCRLTIQDDKVGSIFLPDNMRQPKRTLTVVKVGPGRWFPPGENLRPAPCKPGDVVFVLPSQEGIVGLPLTIDGKDYTLLEAEDILGTFPPGTEVNLESEARVL